METEIDSRGDAVVTVAPASIVVEQVVDEMVHRMQEREKEKPFFFRLLEEAALKEGLHTEMVGPLMEVRNGVKRVITPPDTENPINLNSASASRICDNKEWTAIALKRAGFNVLEGINVDMEQDSRYLEKAEAFARFNQYPVFVKPKDSTYAQGARPIHSDWELAEHLRCIRPISSSALVQEYVDQPEYRIFALNGEVEYTHRREKPAIVGDGQRSVRELLEAGGGIAVLGSSLSENSEYFSALLDFEGLDETSVLPAGVKLNLTPHAGLHGGGKLRDYTTEVSEDCAQWTRDLARALDLKGVCGIDLFAPDGLEYPDTFKVIEVNASASVKRMAELHDREKGVDIFRKILRLYFKNCGKM